MRNQKYDWIALLLSLPSLFYGIIYLISCYFLRIEMQKDVLRLIVLISFSALSLIAIATSKRKVIHFISILSSTIVFVLLHNNMVAGSIFIALSLLFQIFDNNRTIRGICIFYVCLIVLVLLSRVVFRNVLRDPPTSLSPDEIVLEGEVYTLYKTTYEHRKGEYEITVVARKNQTVDLFLFRLGSKDKELLSYKALNGDDGGLDISWEDEHTVIINGEQYKLK